MNKTRIALLSAALVIGAACSSPGNTSDAGGQSKAGAPAAPAGTQPAASSAPAAPAAQKGPWATFADGTYEIGDKDGHVAPGKYKTTVPANAIVCYWERLKDTSGDFGAIIANETGKAGQPMLVTIAKTDGAFKTTGCGTWSRA